MAQKKSMGNFSREWRPDSENPLPLYEQIRRHIRDCVAQGDWPPGQRLPSQRQLAETWGINRSTLIEALEELKAEGILVSRTGSGIQVANNTWALFAGGAGTNWNRYIGRGLHTPNQPTVQAINRYEFEPGIIRLGTGELTPSLYPARMLQEVLHRTADRIPDLNYLEGRGLLELREILCKRAMDLGIQATPSQVIITTGALQALQLISMGITPHGSTILTEQPSYLQSLKVFQSSGMHLKGIPMDSSGLMLSGLKKAIRAKETPFLYTIPTYHNPTGITMPLERRRALLDMCQTERIPIVEDDIYRDLWLEEKPPVPIKALDRYGNVIYLGSVSKSLAPGLRIGWVIGSEAVVERLADIKMQTDYGSSSLSQWALAEWLGSGLYDQHTEMVRQELRLRRERALAALDLHFRDLAVWDKPTGGFYIWLRLKKRIPLQPLFERALKRNILLNPGYLYEEETSSNLRLSYAYASPEELEKGIAQLAELVEERQKE